MTKNQKTIRIVLSEDASNIVKKLAKSLKQEGSFIKVNPSGLVSFIVEIFHHKHQSKEFKKIKEKFFDEKSYIQNVVKNSSSKEEMEEKLRAFLSPKRKTKEHNAKNYLDNSESNE